MNNPYPIPNIQSNPGQFTANSSLILGSFDKPVDAISYITVDYSLVIPTVTILNCWFKISPGGMPQLSIVASNIASTSLTLDLAGGIAGQAYEVIINTKLADGQVRSDTLTVNVLGDDDDCGCATPSSPPGNNVTSIGGSSVIVNTAPRFFVSSVPPSNANVLDRWYDPSTGNLYDYISTGAVTEWVLINGVGVSIGGNGRNIITLSPITPDGSARTFTLSMAGGTVNITVANTLFVSVDGVWQQPGTQYAATGNTITFTEAPSADSVIFMIWFAPAS